jgi:hypothetical protein
MSETYLFDSDSLYLVGGGLTPEVVEPMTLECYEVELVGRNFLGGQRIQFKIKGRDDTLYESSYAWAFVLNTPENLEAVKHRTKLMAARDKAKKAATVADAKVIKFA